MAVLAVVGPGSRQWARLHHLSFLLWLVVVIIHVARLALLTYHLSARWGG
jgi:hypothetical protein